MLRLLGRWFGVSALFCKFLAAAEPHQVSVQVRVFDSGLGAVILFNGQEVTSQNSYETKLDVGAKISLRTRAGALQPNEQVVGFQGWQIQGRKFTADELLAPAFDFVVEEADQALEVTADFILRPPRVICRLFELEEGGRRVRVSSDEAKAFLIHITHGKGELDVCVGPDTNFSTPAVGSSVSLEKAAENLLGWEVVGIQGPCPWDGQKCNLIMPESDVTVDITIQKGAKAGPVTPVSEEEAAPSATPLPTPSEPPVATALPTPEAPPVATPVPNPSIEASPAPSPVVVPWIPDVKKVPKKKTKFRRELLSWPPTFGP